MIDQAAIEARKADLLAQQQALLDQLNAVMGAVQDCDYWLGVLAKRAERSDGPYTLPVSGKVKP